MQNACHNHYNLTFMKYAIISLITFAASALCSSAQTPQQFFQMPVVPDSIVLLHDRTDYLLAHYWDFCDIKKALSSRDKFRGAVVDFFSLMPYGTVGGVTDAMQSFMKKVSTSKEPVLLVSDIAEATFYSDTAAVPSDQLYLIFLDQFLANKKVDKTTKLRYEHIYRILDASQPGKIAPVTKYTDILGQEHTIVPDTTKAGAIVFFNDPDCSECSMARLRIDTDVLSRMVIDRGIVDFYCIYAGEPDDQWRQSVTSYPENWKVGASENADQQWDLRFSPVFYVLNRDGSILLSTSNAGEIIDILGRLAQVSGNAPSAFTRRHSQPAADPAQQPSEPVSEPQP